jgi:FkbM family methyltransferase
MRSAVNATLQKLGYRFTRWEPYPFAPHVVSLAINLVLDVGANVGQFGRSIRASGYRGRIVSFEPVKSAYDQLAATIDPSWVRLPTALGSVNQQSIINVNRNSDMSSLRTLDENHARKHGFNSAGTQKIDVVRLDDIFDQYAKKGDNILLKLDVQGYEDEVLKGASVSLSKIKAIQTEMALSPTYAGQSQMIETVMNLARQGFQLVDIMNGFRETDGCLLEADGFFIRREA